MKKSSEKHVHMHVHMEPLQKEGEEVSSSIHAHEIVRSSCSELYNFFSSPAVVWCVRVSGVYLFVCVCALTRRRHS
jgi:disulfide bond formation protein DsbB